MAKNTLLLYLRLILTMVISIYISRVLLNILGVTNFGVFSVVSSAVTMFSFLNNSLAYGTQRFITFELGANNITKAQQMFIMSINIHVILAVLMFVIAFFFGKYLIYEKLTISLETIDDAYNAYLLLLLGFVINLMTTPYVGVLIAKEKFNAIAMLGVIESVLKLSVTFLLGQHNNAAALTTYASYLLVVTILVRVLHLYYVHIKLKFSSLFLFWNKQIFKDMFSFSSWGLFGGVSSILMVQGVNIILNIFFGPIVNAARALALQINYALSQFSSNLQMVFKPRIIKSYASGDVNTALELTLSGAKYNFFLMLMIALPVMVNSEFLLELWLEAVPKYTHEFTLILIMILLAESLSGTLMTLASATGNIKGYQIVVGVILLLNLPISYTLIVNGGEPVVTLYVQLALSILALCARLLVLENQFKGLIKKFIERVIIRCALVSVVNFMIMYKVLDVIKIDSPLIMAVSLAIMCIISGVLTVLVFGLDKQELTWLGKKLKLNRLL